LITQIFRIALNLLSVLAFWQEAVVIAGLELSNIPGHFDAESVFSMGYFTTIRKLINMGNACVDYDIHFVAEWFMCQYSVYILPLINELSSMPFGID
jgi:hypothetical protein